MVKDPTGIDPRRRRTRRMLLDGLEHLLETKDIDQIAVADIAAVSTVNRATFYDHYSDKFDLLEGLVEAKFQQLLADRQVIFDGACSSALIAITLAACDYLASIANLECPERQQMGKHYESAIGAVVRRMILSGLKEHPPQSDLSPELIAATISGAICGGAREWARTPNRSPAEAVANSIFTLIGPILRETQTRPAIAGGSD
jgi:AcrR family transcriptional regulator